MTYSDYSLTLEEYTNYRKTGKLPTKLQEIWEDLLARLEKEGETDVLTEAKKKGFSLEPNPDIEDDVIAEYKIITVPDSTEQLKKTFFEKLYPYVVCLKI